MHISFSDARPDLARPISSVDFAYAILTIRYKDNTLATFINPFAARLNLQNL